VPALEGGAFLPASKCDGGFRHHRQLLDV